MSVAARLSVFAVLLALLFAGGLAAGAAIDPERGRDGEEQPSQQGTDRDHPNSDADH